MAVSGSTNYNENRDEIIKDALMLLGAVHEDEVVQASTKNYAARALNKMVKAWNAQGIHLWQYREGAIILHDDEVKYTLDTATESSVAQAFSLAATTVDADAGALVVGGVNYPIAVVSAVGIEVGDIIIAIADDGTAVSSTIDYASTTAVHAIGTTDDLSSYLTGSNVISTYPATGSNVSGVLQVTDVRLRNADGNDRVLTRLSRQEYFQINNKTSEASPNSYYIDEQLDNPVMYLWPEPNNPKEQIRFTYSKSIDDFDASTDNADFPQEWLECITYNLAVRLAPYLSKEAKLQVIVPMAQMFLEELKSWDNEAADLQIIPEYYR